MLPMAQFEPWGQDLGSATHYIKGSTKLETDHTVEAMYTETSFQEKNNTLLLASKKNIIMTCFRYNRNYKSKWD